MVIQELQKEIKVWAELNFPDSEDYLPLLGLQEELGELSHSFLKRHQQIKMFEDHDAKIIDAVGDIYIFLAHFCIQQNINMENAVIDTWDKVRRRKRKEM